MKRKTVIAILIVLLLTLLGSSLLGHSDYYNKYAKYKYGFIPYYSTIDNKCSQKDRALAQQIVNLAGEIMTDTLGNIPENAGELGVYAVNKESDYSKIEAKINIITADFSFNSGYIWVEYSREYFTKGDSSAEKKENLAYWKLKKLENQWQVVKIKQVQCENQ